MRCAWSEVRLGWDRERWAVSLDELRISPDRMTRWRDLVRRVAPPTVNVGTSSSWRTSPCAQAPRSMRLAGEPRPLLGLQPRLLLRARVGVRQPRGAAPARGRGPPARARRALRRGVQPRRRRGQLALGLGRPGRRGALPAGSPHAVGTGARVLEGGGEGVLRRERRAVPPRLPRRRAAVRRDPGDRGRRGLGRGRVEVPAAPHLVPQGAVSRPPPRGRAPGTARRRTPRTRSGASGTGARW